MRWKKIMTIANFNLRVKKRNIIFYSALIVLFLLMYRSLLLSSREIQIRKETIYIPEDENATCVKYKSIAESRGTSCELICSKHPKHHPIDTFLFRNINPCLTYKNEDNIAFSGGGGLGIYAFINVFKRLFLILITLYAIFTAASTLGEEKSKKTIRILYCLPFKRIEILMGKFFAVFIPAAIYSAIFLFALHIFYYLPAIKTAKMVDYGTATDMIKIVWERSEILNKYFWFKNITLLLEFGLVLLYIALIIFTGQFFATVIDTYYVMIASLFVFVAISLFVFFLPVHIGITSIISFSEAEYGHMLQIERLGAIDKINQFLTFPLPVFFIWVKTLFPLITYNIVFFTAVYLALCRKEIPISG
jgi:hypothetical protein